MHSNDHGAATAVYPTSFRLGAIVTSLALAVFLYGLDQTIIATAIPKIADHFRALTDVGWYAAAYLFTSSAFQLLFGKLFTIFSIKIVYLFAVAIFELGSLICATAPNSGAFIVGRAIAGVGAAGLYSGAVIILSRSTPLETRPRYIGMLGAAVGIASITGPFLGGAFA
jgi:MFS family permease